MAVAVVIGVAAYRLDTDIPFHLAGLGAVVLILLLNGLLHVHYKVTLRRLEENHPELWAAEAESNECSPLNRMSHYNEAQRKNFGCCGGVVLMICAVIACGASLFLDITEIAMSDDRSEYAKEVYITANTWRKWQEDAGNPTELYTVIVNYGEEYAEGSLEKELSGLLRIDGYTIGDMHVHDKDVEGGCAIVCDENGALLYALWSETPLTEADLIFLEQDTQYEQENPYADHDTIGYYGG